MNRKHLNYPPPQVPRSVREVLKDYPEVIEDLQNSLTTIHYGMDGPMDFERAVWRLKDKLGGRQGDANRDTDRAKARGDLDAAKQSNEKAMVLAKAGHSIHAGDDLWSYFQTYEKDFR